MIKVNGEKGKFKVEGDKPSVKAEVTTLLEFLVSECSFTDEDIDDCVKMSRMDIKEKMDMVLEKMFKALFDNDEGDEDGE